MNLLCSVFGHRRSAKRAFRTLAGWSSYCRRCGMKLHRSEPGMWIISSAEAGQGDDAHNLVVFKSTGDQLWIRGPLQHAYRPEPEAPFTDLVQAIDAADNEGSTC
jgi:hypothetical protein